jgi:solute carrier family 66 (lysosomal lysine-arginine transporter), member 1
MTLSYILGYLSILSWLCAQLPQIITNYQNSSVDGLAPIFLTNWFMVSHRIQLG